MKDDELFLLIRAYHGCNMREILKSATIPQKRAWHILEKWAKKGWYEYGVNLELGWLTEKGRDFVMSLKSGAVAFGGKRMVTVYKADVEHINVIELNCIKTENWYIDESGNYHHKHSCFETEEKAWEYILSDYKADVDNASNELKECIQYHKESVENYNKALHIAELRTAAKSTCV